ncbi:MAG TPA: hypothetical protein VEK79_05905 [Thermoanaerobaculia bacterium]|nr:hypothetical protein [Thermoanaerobaculia bacterium]
MKWLKWFIAGALAVPLLHQVVLALLNAAGVIARQPFAMTPTEPFGVPQVISLSFWGGIWGIILGLLLVRTKSARAFWLIAIVVGAIAPTLVAGLVVAPLKGQPAGGDAKMFAIGLLINGAWGLGTAALYRLMNRSGTTG